MLPASGPVGRATQYAPDHVSLAFAPTKRWV